MPKEYYASFSREVQESEGQMRSGLEFEVVEADKLDCFLNKQANDRILASEEYQDVFSKFQEFGLTDERFEKIKTKYLGETGFSMVTVFFNNLSYKKYQYENWYLIRTSAKRDDLNQNETIYDAGSYDWSALDEPEANCYCNLEVLKKEDTKTLRRLYKPYIPDESQVKADKRGKAVSAIAQNTQLGAVDFLYVGAALCVEILESNGNTTAFFDLGTKVSNKPDIIAQRPAARSSHNYIIRTLRGINPQNRVTIFISHWHTDHYDALGAFSRNGVFNNASIANNTEWYVPGSGLPVFQMMQNAIVPGNFHVFQQGFSQNAIPVNGNPNISYGKINILYPNNRPPHPHHQGLYVILRTAGNTTVFLSGDTTYWGIPENERKRNGAGYDVLQACHHGGNYHYYPADRNLVTAPEFIPTVSETGGGVIYSADGMTYGHPDDIYVVDHTGQGWETIVYLLDGARLGKNFCRVT